MPADYAQTIGFILDNFKATAVFTASPTQSQGNGPLQSGFTRINTVVTAGDTVTLPVATNAKLVILLNDDAGQRVQVFPASGASIDDEATDASVNLFPQQTTVYRAVSTTAWFRQNLVRGTEVGITASTTPTQPGGRPIIAEYNEVPTVANDNDAVTLFPVFPGAYCFIRNTDAGQILQVFPAANDEIDKIGLDLSITLAAGTSIILHGLTTTRWFS